MTEKLSQLLAGQTLMIGGHRGLSGIYPENTLSAVRAAIDMGVDLIEIDIYLSKDGVPVLAHDQKLDRCSNGTGYVFEHTLAELRKLDFGVYRGEQFRGTSIATLEEFFDMMKAYPNVLIDVDIKPYYDNLNCCKKAVALARSMNIIDRCIFNSIDGDVVDALYEQIGRRIVGAPDFWPPLKNFKFRYGKEGTYSHLWGVCVPLQLLTESVANQLRDEYGLTVVCTPADTAPDVQLALKCGVKLPLCNNPEAFLLAVRSRG